MNTTFTTTSSKLTIKNGTIWEKRIIDPEKSYWLHSFILLCLFIGYSVHEAIYERALDWLYVLLGFIWIAPHLKRIYGLLFVKAWRWYLPIAEVSKVKVDPDYNELEHRVVLVLKSGRKKEYLFRTAEQQAASFVQSVSAAVTNAPSAV